MRGSEGKKFERGKIKKARYYNKLTKTKGLFVFVTNEHKIKMWRSFATVPCADDGDTGFIDIDNVVECRIVDGMH